MSVAVYSVSYSGTSYCGSFLTNMPKQKKTEKNIMLMFVCTCVVMAIALAITESKNVAYLLGIIQTGVLYWIIDYYKTKEN